MRDTHRPALTFEEMMHDLHGVGTFRLDAGFWGFQIAGISFKAQRPIEAP